MNKEKIVNEKIFICWFYVLLDLFNCKNIFIYFVMIWVLLVYL